ncbi:MAG: hypothetical protein ACRECW_02825 [Phyllobacterium sp.]
MSRSDQKQTPHLDKIDIPSSIIDVKNIRMNEPDETVESRSTAPESADCVVDAMDDAVPGLFRDFVFTIAGQAKKLILERPDFRIRVAPRWLAGFN